MATGAPERIVVGYDGSDQAREALRAACRLAGPDSSITVVHAYNLPPEVQHYEFLSDLEGAFERAAAKVLESAREIASECEADVQLEPIAERPAQALARVASREGADLIVVGSRGAGAVRAALGSVTLRLLHLAGCPVLVVPGARQSDKGAEGDAG